jgi:preprotein translocase subunit SecE
VHTERFRSPEVPEFANQKKTMAFEKVTQYLQEVAKETRKVNWPSRQDLVSNTVLTLVASLLIALVIFAQDQVISRVLQFIY